MIYRKSPTYHVTLCLVASGYYYRSCMPTKFSHHSVSWHLPALVARNLTYPLCDDWRLHFVHKLRPGEINWEKIRQMTNERWSWWMSIIDDPHNEPRCDRSILPPSEFSGNYCRLLQSSSYSWDKNIIGRDAKKVEMWRSLFQDSPYLTPASCHLVTSS